MELLGVSAEQAGGEAEAAIAGFLDRGVEILDPDDLQHGPEDLLVRPVLRLGHVDQRRTEIRPPFNRPLELAQRLAAFLDQLLPLLLDAVRGGHVDDGPHERLRLGEGLADDQPAGELLDRLEQSSMLAVLHDQPARRGAALAGGEIGRLDDDRRGRFDLLRVPHDQRVVAAELEREDFVRGFGELPVQRHSGARRTGEQQPVDARLARQLPAFVGPADQQPNEPFGDLRLVEAFDEQRPGRRRLFRRLEYHRVAGDQRRDDVSVGKVRGEIIRSEDGQHAVRLVLDRNLVPQVRFELPPRRALAIGVDGDFDLVDHRGDLGSRFPQGLSGLFRDQLGERFLLRADDIGETAQRLEPVGLRMGGPGRLRRTGSRDLGGGIADLARPDFLAGRRIGGNESFRHSRAVHQRRALVKLPVHPAPSPRPFGGWMRPCRRTAASRRDPQ